MLPCFPFANRAAQLTDEQLHALGKCLKRKRYANGETIIRQGTKGSSFFFVEKVCA